MKISCVIPAFNEESTIIDVIKNVKKVKVINEIIVVDDGSTDNTYKNAKSEGIRVIKHAQNKGKGAAIKTGIAHSHGDIILFLDADLYSISPKKVASILQPLENDEADFVKTSFTRARGRVTELVVKPLFSVIFPFIKFNQPLSGQFAIKRDLLKELKIDDKWGVDIQILLQLVKKGVRILEVDIGKLKHKKQPIENLIIMSEQVIKTILSELGIIANKHKLVLFDFDKTLIRESSIEVVAKEFGFQKELQKLRADYENGKIKDYNMTLELASLIKGRTETDFDKIFKRINLRRTAKAVIDRLKKRQYNVGIISVAFSPIIHYFADKIGVDRNNVICPILVTDKHGRYTGEVIAKTRHNSKCCDKIICKADAAKELMKRLKVKPEESVAVGDGKSDECLFRACGLSLAYKPLTSIGDVNILNLAEVLIYAE
ncbi:MAG TPA: HAD-IB family phosphatase [Candidatus Nanoarchaeia archaeon]|nr:HAD-IB family phosphatase [Candidatus Nanoarchaeia archaeon]